MRILHVLRLRRFVEMCDLMHTTHNGFHANLLDIVPNFITGLILLIFSVCIDVIEDGRKRALVPDIIVVLIFVLNESVGLFIDSIIG